MRWTFILLMLLAYRRHFSDVFCYQQNKMQRVYKIIPLFLETILSETKVFYLKMLSAADIE